VSSTSERDFYDILGVQKGADKDDIKAVAGIDHISDIVRTNKIDCEFKWVPGYLHARLNGTDKKDRKLLEKDARASAAVIEQRLRPLGYDGGHTILREYIHKVRPQPQSKRAFVRMEPEAGERFEVDWGHFGTLHYEGDQREGASLPAAEPH